ncbi:type IV secretory system conjugative DNA transfer family protein [Rhodococcus phenolicus]|uniref:type IV secretory system conjugative DNA transfer family protein n=1 Tax=Rhodococcus phenolicus TaxID=263849 RepID=UPI000AE89A05|nr:TraM recognition domain-containing protein [Rhodococcus phenolicus]
MTERGQARPSQPVIPVGTGPLVAVIGGVLWSVYVGGAVAGVVTGSGLVWPDGLYGSLSVLRTLVLSPGDPTAGWPEDGRPGSAAVTWVCLIVAALLYITATVVVRANISARQRAKRRRQQGFADPAELRRRGLDRRSAVKAATTNRASLRETPARKIEAHDVATRIGTLYGEHGKDAEVFTQYRDGTLVEGPTGSGKSWRLAWQRIVESVGFVLATTTKPDLLWSSVGQRLAVGPVEVFDPEGITRWPTPMRWSLLAGCDDPDTAIRRADALVQAVPIDGDTKNAGYFSKNAAKYLRCCLYAAAVSGSDVTVFYRWAMQRQVPKVKEILDRDLPTWSVEYSQLGGSGSDSVDDVMSTVSTLLDPLASPKLMAAVNVTTAESVDLEQLIRDGGTLYLISEGSYGSSAPIVTALAAEAYYLAKEISREYPEERIDPPVRFVLDEVNNVAPIPDLPDKVSDSAGRGISIWVFCHGQEQNIRRWGPSAGRMFTTNSPVRIILPGLGDVNELEQISRLTGERDEWWAPNQAPRQTKVMTAPEIRGMPADQALMIYRGSAPALVHLPLVWDIAHWKQRVLDSQEVYDWICETGELPDWAWSRETGKAVLG